MPVVYGCRSDPVESHRAFVAKHDLDISLLPDPDHAVMAVHGAWGPRTAYGRDTLGVIPSTALIDPGGIVAHHRRRASTGAHAGKVLSRLASLRVRGQELAPQEDDGAPTPVEQPRSLHHDPSRPYTQG